MGTFCLHKSSSDSPIKALGRWWKGREGRLVGGKGEGGREVFFSFQSREEKGIEIERNSKDPMYFFRGERET